MSAFSIHEYAIEAAGDKDRRLSPLLVPLHRLIGHIVELMSSLGTIWFFALMFLISAEVLSRQLFNLPLNGIPEMVAYSMVGAAALQLANTLFCDRMIRADFVVGTLQAQAPRLAITLETWVSLIGLAAMILLFQAGLMKFERSYSSSELVGVPGFFSFQVWPFRLLMVIGAAMTAIGFALRAIWTLISQHHQSGWRPVIVNLIGAALIACLVVAALDAPFVSGLPNLTIGAVMIALLVLIVCLGVHVGVALITTGFIGLWLLKGKIIFAYTMLGIAANEYLASYYFCAIPLFVLMGLLVSAADIGKETFMVARWIMRPILGGLGIATVAANAIFAAITGSSIASAAVFSKIATPEMLAHGYTKRFSVGVVAGSSVLGMLIPPSILLIVYGLVAEQSIGVLFISALIPGVVLAGVMCIMIMAMAKFMPGMIFEGGKPPSDEGSASLDAKQAAVLVAPLIALIALVLGGIYGGFFTPTEGGAIGSLGALLFALARRRLNWTKLWGVMVETGQITTAVLFLVFAANVFTRMLASSGLVQQVSVGIVELQVGLIWFTLLYVALLIVLGMFLESVSIMLIVVPIALPASIALGADPIWFGILTVITVEIGLLTPPLGLTCYVVKATLRDMDISLAEIFKGAFPFVLAMAAVVALLMIFPQLATQSF